MLKRKENTTEVANSASCTVWEYGVPSAKLGLATARIRGRFPDQGEVRNTICDEAYLVVSGTGVVHHESGDFKIREGDAFYFERGKWFWIEGRDLYVVVPTSPPWDPKQHEHRR